MAKKTLIVIEPEDAKIYSASIRAIQRRLQLVFYRTEDLSTRKWINKHGAILDDLLDELRLK